MYVLVDLYVYIHDRPQLLLRSRAISSTGIWESTSCVLHTNCICVCVFIWDLVGIESVEAVFFKPLQTITTTVIPSNDTTTTTTIQHPQQVP